MYANIGVPADVIAMFSDAELAEIAAAVPPSERADDLDAIGLARAWEARVAKIDDDRPLPWTDRRVWNEHDLAGTMYMRNFVENALNRLRPELAAKVRRYVARADERFRSYTTEDSGERMARIADVAREGRGWWWFRVPTSGPIAEDLARY